MKIFSRLKSMLNRSNLAKFAVCVAYSASLVFTPLSVASAAPAVVPVSAELIVELLLALEIISGSAATGYVISENCDPYTASILQEQVSMLTYDIPISEETIEQAGLLGSVIPDDVYTYNGSSFSVSGSADELTESDLFLTAKSLVGTTYGMPTNISGIQAFWGRYGSGFLCSTSFDAVGEPIYYIPYYITPTAKFINESIVSFPSSTSFSAIDLSDSKTTTGNISGGLKQFLYYPGDNYSGWGTGNKSSGTDVTIFLNGIHGSSSTRRVFGTGSFKSSDVSSTSCLTTSGVPSFDIVADKVNLEKSVVQVKKEDDNNGSTPPVPQSPNNWEIWRTADDLLDFIDTGISTNGGTTFEDFVNNNYNYVDVDINVPDTIHTDVNLAGGLDINGSGDINVTIHEDVSLPSAGDGSGFYNPDAADVVGALGKDNPVVGVVSGIFSAIDPSLLGIFSVSVSLLFVLGLWKLIRG